MDSVSFNETQLKQILAAIDASHDSGWWHWLPVASVFISALLAFLIGIGLEKYKDSRAAEKDREQQREKEIRQINAVVAGIGFNLETLVHITSQNILPHYRDSHAAYDDISAAKGDAFKIAEFFGSMDRYRAAMMTCPDLKFIEFDFWRELLFIIERDAEVLKRSGWLVSFANEIKDLTRRRNQHIENVSNLIAQQGGKLNFYALQAVLQRNASIADSECVVASQLAQVLIDMGKELERINDKKQGKKITLPQEAEDVISQLKAVSDHITPKLSG